MAVDDPLQAFTIRGTTKIHEQPKGLLCKSQVGEQLLAMYRQQFFDGLHFNDKRMLNEKVDPKPLLKHDSLIVDRHWLLPLNE